MAAFEVDAYYGKLSWASATEYEEMDHHSPNANIGRAKNVCIEYKRIYRGVIKYVIEMQQSLLNNRAPT